jgi:hypothetical protein
VAYVDPGEAENVADELKSKVDEVGADALEQFGKSHRELNETIPILKGLGLSVRNFRGSYAGAGDPARLGRQRRGHRAGQAESRDRCVLGKEAARERAGGAADRRTAEDQLGDLRFRGVSADIVLSVPPAVNVEFRKDPPPLDV